MIVDTYPQQINITTSNLLIVTQKMTQMFYKEKSYERINDMDNNDDDDDDIYI